MLMKVANIIIIFLERKGAIDSRSREIYLYGCEAALYTMLSTSGLLIIGILFRQVLETVIIVGLFYLNQSLGGGFHANTHMRCFVTMSTGLLCAFIACDYLQPEKTILILLVLLATAILLCHPLVLHANKQYLKYKTPIFIARSRTAVCMQALVSIESIFFPYSRITYAFVYGLLLCAFSRSVAIMRLHK